MKVWVITKDGVPVNGDWRMLMGASKEEAIWVWECKRSALWEDRAAGIECEQFSLVREATND